VNGSGETSRDFTYVDNVVAANVLAASPETPSGLTCNVACGTRTTLLQLLDAISTAVGRDVEPTHGPPRPGDIQHSLADISVAQRELGYQVVVPFSEGISRTVDWYRRHPDSLSGIGA
jgi:nucleoside-diphosphate-sugar epimerase